MKKIKGLLTIVLLTLAVHGYGSTFGWGNNSQYFGGSKDDSNSAYQAAEIPSSRPVNHWWKPLSASTANTSRRSYTIKTSAKATTDASNEYEEEEIKVAKPAKTKKKQNQTDDTSASVTSQNNQKVNNDPGVIAYTTSETPQENDIESPLPRFTQDPYGLPQPVAVESVQPNGRELLSGTKYKQSEGILTGEGMPQIHPHLGLLYVYDSNFLILPEDEVDDFIFVTSPGLSLEIGRQDLENPDYNRFDASYTANIIRFLDHTENDTIDQDANTMIRYQFGKTTLGLQQNVSTITDSTIDIGTRTHREIYSTLLSAKHSISDKTYIDLSGAQFVTNFGTRDLSDNIEWATQLMLNYKITPKVTLGVGPKIGWVDITDNPNQMYEDALARLFWEASAKLSFNVTGGVEFRQWQDGAVGDVSTGIFEIGANWDPFDGTRTSYRVYRRNEVSASAFGENYIATGFGASLRQRLYRRIYLGLTGGYDHADYYTGSPLFTTDREDDFYSIRPSISYVLAEWGTVGLFYEYRRNESNHPELEFREHIYGLEASFRY